jgi:hypothetical protein
MNKSTTHKSRWSFYFGVPPPPVKEKFARLVAAIRKMEEAQAASRHRLEALFLSMLHRAFNGELRDDTRRFGPFVLV